MLGDEVQRQSRVAQLRTASERSSCAAAARPDASFLGDSVCRGSSFSAVTVCVIVMVARGSATASSRRDCHCRDRGTQRRSHEAPRPDAEHVVVAYSERTLVVTVIDVCRRCCSMGSWRCVPSTTVQNAGVQLEQGPVADLLRDCVVGPRLVYLLLCGLKYIRAHGRRSIGT